MASRGRRTYLKDLKELYTKLESSTDGQGRVLSSTDSETVVQLRPNSGYNANASFQLTMHVSSQYPSKPPDVKFFTPIFHPNIAFFQGSVCLSVLDNWTGCYGLLDIVKAILYLIDNPNFDSANNCFGSLNDEEVLEVMTKRVLAGLPVGVYRKKYYSPFPPNRDWCEWAAERGFRPEENLLDEDASIDAKLIALSHESPLTHNAAVEIDNYSDDRNSERTISSWSSLNTVPSVARIRYSVADNVSGYSTDCYVMKHIFDNILLQRILIRHPDDEDKEESSHSVYYYCSMIPKSFDLHRLGRRYDGLHREDHHTRKMYDRQSSSLIPWLNGYLNSYNTPNFYSSRSTSLCVDLLFEHILHRPGMTQQKEPRIPLTSDFCPWTQTDNLGITGIFDFIFARRETPPQSLDDFELEGMFSSISIDNINEVDERELEKICATDDCDVNLCSSIDSDEDQDDADCEGEEEEDSNQHQTNPEEVAVDNDDSNTTSNTSSNTSNEGERSVGPYVELYDYHRAREVFAQVEPQWHWFFRQSRWPLRFAPDQTLDVSMEDIRVPPWRNTAGRLMSDVCYFCKRRPDVINLILLDPMALSPLSPVLNMMRFSSEFQPLLVGVLWLNPLDAISPFYRLPIPPRRDGDSHSYPGATQLRLLALTAIISNWLSWFSRIEVYSSLGQSRFSSELISDSVAAHILGPYSLGCGQAPVFDLWPLWLARRLFTLSWSFPWSPNCVFVPFSDLDEI